MDFSMLGSAFRFIGIGWYIIICLIGGAFLGRLIDNNLDYNFPVFTIVFTVIGAIIAVVGVGLMIRSFIEKNPKGI